MGTDKPRATASGRPAAEPEGATAPTSEKLPDGQLADHWVLPAEERAKGYVRPVRTSYKHVGAQPTHPLRDLTDQEKERYPDRGYVKFEDYPPDSGAIGRFWTKAGLEGCGAVTTMARSIAETYARDPGYYGSTFCVGCGTYRPVAAARSRFRHKWMARKWGKC